MFVYTHYMKVKHFIISLMCCIFIRNLNICCPFCCGFEGFELINDNSLPDKLNKLKCDNSGDYKIKRTNSVRNKEAKKDLFEIKKDEGQNIKRKNSFSKTNNKHQNILEKKSLDLKSLDEYGDNEVWNYFFAKKIIELTKLNWEDFFARVYQFIIDKDIDIDLSALFLNVKDAVSKVNKENEKELENIIKFAFYKDRNCAINPKTKVVNKFYNDKAGSILYNLIQQYKKISEDKEKILKDEKKEKGKEEKEEKKEEKKDERGDKQVIFDKFCDNIEEKWNDLKEFFKEYSFSREEQILSNLTKSEINEYIKIAIKTLGGGEVKVIEPDFFEEGLKNNFLEKCNNSTNLPDSIIYSKDTIERILEMLKQKHPKNENNVITINNSTIKIDNQNDDDWLNMYLIGLFNFKKDLLAVFEKEIKIGENNQSWLEWLKQQGGEEIEGNNFPDGFSKLIDNQGKFIQDLTKLDKYFCKMLLVLYLVLKKEDNTDLTDFNNLKGMLRQFLHRKEKLNKINGTQKLSPSDFFNTLFEFMSTMYQKFLKKKPAELNTEGITVEGKNINDPKKRIEEYITKEKNNINLLFGYYYTYPDKGGVCKIKHSFCKKNKGLKTSSFKDLVKFNSIYLCKNVFFAVELKKDKGRYFNIKFNNCETKGDENYNLKTVVYPVHMAREGTKFYAFVNGHSAAFFQDDVFYNYDELLDADWKKEHYKNITAINFSDNENLKNARLERPKQKYMLLFYSRNENERKEEENNKDMYIYKKEKDPIIQERKRNKERYKISIEKKKEDLYNDDKIKDLNDIKDFIYGYFYAREDLGEDKKEEEDKKEIITLNRNDIDNITFEVYKKYLEQEEKKKKKKKKNKENEIEKYRKEYEDYKKNEEAVKIGEIISSEFEGLKEKIKEEKIEDKNEKFLQYLIEGKNICIKKILARKFEEKRTFLRSSLNKDLFLQEDDYSKIREGIKKSYELIKKIKNKIESENILKDLFLKKDKITKEDFKEENKQTIEELFNFLLLDEEKLKEQEEKKNEEEKKEQKKIANNKNGKTILNIFKEQKETIEKTIKQLVLYKSIEKVSEEESLKEQQYFLKEQQELLKGNLFSEEIEKKLENKKKELKQKNVNKTKKVDKSDFETKYNALKNSLEDVKKEIEKLKESNIAKFFNTYKAEDEDVEKTFNHYRKLFIGKKEELERKKVCLEENLKIIYNMVNSAMVINNKEKEEDKKEEEEGKKEEEDKKKKEDLMSQFGLFHLTEKEKEVQMILKELKDVSSLFSTKKIDDYYKIIEEEDYNENIIELYKFFIEEIKPNKNKVKKCKSFKSKNYHDQFLKVKELEIEKIVNFDKNSQKDKKDLILLKQDTIRFLFNDLENNSTNQGNAQKKEQSYFPRNLQKEPYFKGEIDYNDCLFGLINEHYNCFLNSLIQCLLTLSDFFIEVANHKVADKSFYDWLNEKKGNNDQGLNLCFKFLEYIIDVKNKRETLKKSNFDTNAFNAFKNDMLQRAKDLKALWRVYMKVAAATQEDSNEFFLGLLKALETNLEEFDTSINFKYKDEDYIEIKKVGDHFTIKIIDGNSKQQKATTEIKNCNDVWDLFKQPETKKFIDDNFSLLYKNIGTILLCEKKCYTEGCELTRYETIMHFYQSITKDFSDENFFIAEKDRIFSSEDKCEKCKKKTFISNQRYFPIGKYHIIHNMTVSTKNDVVEPVKIKNVHKDIRSNIHGYLHNIASIGYSGSGHSGHFWAKIRSKCNDNCYFECNDSANPYASQAYFKIKDPKIHMYFFKVIDKKI